MTGSEHLRKLMVCRQVRTGNVKDIFENTDMEFSEWVTKKVHRMQYETISELLRDMLLDQYYEETQQ